MPADLPPTLDPVAAARWSRRTVAESPWLHEEVARRMEDRLQWIKLAPAAWAHWEPLQGGLGIQAALARRYPAARCTVVEPEPARRATVARVFQQPWWRAARWSGPGLQFAPPDDGSLQMVWANMALHMAPDPQTLLQRWHQALAPDGFLMFSCLGPDTLRAVREAWSRAGWPEPAHAFTDMHDWGDMLVNTGFAEPVMDMERITLTFASPQRALQELRQLGRNLHVARFQGLRGRSWRDQALAALARSAPVEGTGLALEFEVIYGHALKAQPRVNVQPETHLTLDEMRRVLRHGRVTPGSAQ
jgi:malonyl-CoA O-methyltransferase